MKFHVQQAIRAFILLAFSILLFKLYFTGDMTKFINPKYVWLSQSAAVLFLILFIIQVTRTWTIESRHEHHCQHHDHDHSCCHDHGSSPFNHKKLMAYTVIIFPLLTGFLLPPKVLDASIVDKKGGMAVLTKQKQIKKENEEMNRNQEEPIIEHSKVIEPKEITEKEYEQIKQNLKETAAIKMDDHVYSYYYEEINLDPNKFKGREIELKGFVYKEDEFKPNQLVISRFLITHCVADASIIGFLSELPEASKLEENTWMEVKGVLDISTFNGEEIPMIKINKWTVIKEPGDPYLYPITVRIL
ncbi:putative membrane protein [Oikeobacillus pervagus]|uniref:Membrane protein n=1 Tax=Oikeobacillus pervagus TaxID=1325931 RepID=A0AAJ1SWG9_9BACI|nr:TIGR03943 family protein [Oikeobacillus pervagus]MDQ0214015.1 putative membrane protein [Oikeobacillus pervagus]